MNHTDLQQLSLIGKIVVLHQRVDPLIFAIRSYLCQNRLLSNALVPIVIEYESCRVSVDYHVRKIIQVFPEFSLIVITIFVDSILEVVLGVLRVAWKKHNFSNVLIR